MQNRSRSAFKGDGCLDCLEPNGASMLFPSIPSVRVSRSVVDVSVVPAAPRHGSSRRPHVQLRRGVSYTHFHSFLSFVPPIIIPQLIQCRWSRISSTIRAGLGFELTGKLGRVSLHLAASRMR